MIGGALKISLKDRDGNEKAVALVSPEDAHLADMRWSLSSNGYAVKQINNKQVHLRRLVAGVTDDRTLLVRNVNGDVLDCRRDNLVVVKRPKDAFRAARLRRYGLTEDDFDELLALQKGKCAICESECVTGRNFAVDHDHETGNVRGLLCFSCNTAIGKLNNPDLLRKAAKYLEMSEVA